MASGIDAIMDAIVTIQKAITPPADEKDIAQAFDEPPSQVTTFPAFVNVETAVREEGSSGLREFHWTIEMHLLFTTADAKYSVRSRRKWVSAVIDKFCQELTLSGTVSGIYEFQVDYEPYVLGETPYVAANFQFVARQYEGFAFDS